MKKGLIVEQKRNKTFLMTSEGSFYKSKKINGEIGEETTFEPIEQNIFQLITRWFHSLTHAKPVFAAIIAFLFILPFYSWLGEEDVHAYMNIDINPSVELSLNEDYEVIDLHGLNHDGNTIIKQLDDWKGEPVKEVSLNILSLSDELGFIQEGHQVLLGISYVNEHVNQDLLQSVSQEMKTSSKPIEVAAFEVPKELLKKAHEQKISMNFVYATELIEKKEQLKEIEKDSAKQSSNNKIEEQNMKVIEKFVEQSKQLPPGLKKKLEKAKEAKQNEEEPEVTEETQQKEKEYPKDADHPSQKNKDNKGKQHEDDWTPPGKEKKDDDWTPPGQKKQENDWTPSGKKEQDDEGTPPGKKNEEGDWTPPGKDRDKPNQSSNGKKHQDDRFSKTPGLDKKAKDHPGNGQGNPH